MVIGGKTVMADTSYPNIPTIEALVMMTIAMVAVTIAVGFIFKKYFERKRVTALTLGTAFLLWDLGGISLLALAILHYISGLDLAPGHHHARYGINIAYAFSALSNIFMVLFVSQIYSQTRMFRKTKKIIPIINALLNGVTIGMIIDVLIQSFTTEDVNQLYNPQYPLAQTIYHLVLTFIAFTFLLVFSAQARKRATLRWEKTGFGLIIGSAISGIFIYLLFALDLIVQLAFPTVPNFQHGYTIFNLIGWVFAVAMAVFGLLGFVMPTRLRDWIQAKDEEAI